MIANRLDGCGFLATAAAQISGLPALPTSHQLKGGFLAWPVVLEKAQKELGLMSTVAGRTSGTY